MIANDEELKVTLERIAEFQAQVAHLRKVETNPKNYHLSASGFIAEIDRMQLEVREYLSLHPTELAGRAQRCRYGLQTMCCGGGLGTATLIERLDQTAPVRNEFTAITERDGDWLIAYCPEIPGANGQGKTKEEALASLVDAIALILEDRREVALQGGSR